MGKHTPMDKDAASRIQAMHQVPKVRDGRLVGTSPRDLVEYVADAALRSAAAGRRHDIGEGARNRVSGTAGPGQWFAARSSSSFMSARSPTE
jgi:hypothetical protein